MFIEYLNSVQNNFMQGCIKTEIRGKRNKAVTSSSSSHSGL